MTTFTLQNESSAPSYTDQTKNSTSFTLRDKERTGSLLLKEDGGGILLEDGEGIMLEQAIAGDAWVLQNKS